MKLEGYSNYEIYPETGQIWSYKSNRFVGYKGRCGYASCTLTDDNGKYNMLLVHRVIWVAVNGEIPKDKEINHLDENPMNNSIFNLSMVSHVENANWGTRNKRIIENRTGKFAPKPVIAIKNGKIVLFFSSTREAERITGYSNVSIGRCCNGLKKEYKGYQWMYLEDYLADILEKIQDEDMEMERVA